MKKQRMEISADAELKIADNSEAVIVIRPDKDGGDCTVRLDIGKGCTVTAYTISERKAKINQTNKLKARSSLRSYSLWLSGGEAKTITTLAESGANAREVFVFLAKDSERLVVDSELRHAAPDTRGDILVKGVVKDRARADLGGMIKVMKKGSGAESFLSEHAILLDSGARATADPKLEIENNDVMSRHSASVSQINENKLFYLMTRGLAKDDARSLIVSGFLESAIGRIEDESFRKEFAGMLGKSI